MLPTSWTLGSTPVRPQNGLIHQSIQHPFENLLIESAKNALLQRKNTSSKHISATYGNRRSLRLRGVRVPSATPWWNTAPPANMRVGRCSFSRLSVIPSVIRWKVRVSAPRVTGRKRPTLDSCPRFGQPTDHCHRAPCSAHPRHARRASPCAAHSGRWSTCRHVPRPPLPTAA